MILPRLNNVSRPLQSIALRGLHISDAMASVCMVHSTTLTKLDISECEHYITDITANEIVKCTRQGEASIVWLTMA